MIIINGKTYNGNNLRISNGKVYVDGVLQLEENTTINIQVNGSINSIDVDTCESFSVEGNIGTLRVTNGGIDIVGDVLGNVETTNGNIKANHINGDAYTKNGNITTKKSIFK